MDDWLHRYAGQNRRNNNTAATWVIADQDLRVTANATLSMTAIDHAAAPARPRKAAPPYIGAQPAETSRHLTCTRQVRC